MEKEILIMSNSDPGKFRRKLFGGFHQRDVLDYIKGLYAQMETLRQDAEALAERCEALEGLAPENHTQLTPSPDVQTDQPTDKVSAEESDHTGEVTQNLAEQVSIWTEPKPELDEMVEEAKELVATLDPEMEEAAKNARPTLQSPYKVKPAKVKVRRL